VTVIAPHRFQISAITADIAGEQAFTLDAHITTRGRKIHDIVTVTLGGIVFYCHDGHSVRAFASAWTSVTDHAVHALPERAEFTGGPGYDRHQVGIILHVAGSPARKPAITVVPTDASPTATPYAQVGMGTLTVRAYDLSAIRSWADGWATAEHTANRISPDPDSFDHAEQTERATIARTGLAFPPSTARRTARLCTASAPHDRARPPGPQPRPHV
jgi:hypothetical protein